MATLMAAIAQNLEKHRRAKGLTQAQLAELIGVSRGTIARYESGQGGLDADTIARFADAFGVQETDLVAAGESSEQNAPSAETIARQAAERAIELYRQAERPQWKAAEPMTDLSPVKQELMALLPALEEKKARYVLELLKDVGGSKPWPKAEPAKKNHGKVG